VTITDDATTQTTKPTGATIPVGSPTYNEVLQFLYEEAAFLDNDDLRGWAGVLAPDLVYRAPVRRTTGRGEGRGFHPVMTHFEEDILSIGMRIFRLTDTASAWAEDPPSRTRRLVTNVLAWAADAAEEVRVNSSLLLVRNRLHSATKDILAAERQDVVRRTPEGWRLVRREILLDESVLSTPNLAIFL
jgi:3-phenylpropionate/cinnamic acid dioxygenase small subunit